MDPSLSSGSPAPPGWGCSAATTAPPEISSTAAAEKTKRWIRIGSIASPHRSPSANAWSWFKTARSSSSRCEGACLLLLRELDLELEGHFVADDDAAGLEPLVPREAEVLAVDLRLRGGA